MAGRRDKKRNMGIQEKRIKGENMVTNKKRIGDLVENENVEVGGKVIDVLEAQDLVKKNGETIALQEVILEDSTGSIILKLWGNDANTLKVGNKIKVTGFVSAFKDTLYLSKGKFGKIEAVA